MHVATRSPRSPRRCNVINLGEKRRNTRRDAMCASERVGSLLRFFLAARNVVRRRLGLTTFYPESWSPLAARWCSAKSGAPTRRTRANRWITSSRVCLRCPSGGRMSSGRYVCTTSKREGPKTPLCRRYRGALTAWPACGSSANAAPRSESALPGCRSRRPRAGKRSARSTSTNAAASGRWTA